MKHFSERCSFSRLFVVLFLIIIMSGILFAQEDSTITERRLPVDEYRDKMKAGWIGQMVGVGWGAPTEFRYNARIIPEDEVPVWTPDMVNQFNQDDIYVEMTFLRTLEEYGFDVSITQAGVDFANSGYMLWHANKAGRDNLRAGIAPPNSSHPEFSEHSDDIDYQIEADYSGLIAPGMPNIVIELGEKFGRLVNYGDGLYAGQFVGAMYAEAFFEKDIHKIIDAGLKSIPAESQYAEMVLDVIKWHGENPDDWEKSWNLIEEKYQKNPEYRKFSCSGPDAVFNIDAKINGAYILMGMLYGNGDLDKTNVISMRCGQDSDCNPSNAAGILATAFGFKNLPQKYVSELNEETKFSYTDYNFAELVDVCEQLTRQALLRSGGKIEKDESGNDVFVIPVQEIKLSKLERSWEPGPVSDIVFSDDELSQIQGPAIIKYLLWLLLLLAFVTLKENYNLKSLWILLPLGIVLGLWFLIKSTLSHDIVNTLGMGPVFTSFAVGLAVLALAGEKIAAGKWYISYLIVIILLLAAGLSGVLGSNSGRLDAASKTSLYSFVYWGAAIVLAISITAYNNRKKYSNKRFILYFLFWSVVGQYVTMFVYASISWGLLTNKNAGDILMWVLILGVIQGIIMFIMTLPFLLLFFRNELFRNRFRESLALPAAEND